MIILALYNKEPHFSQSAASDSRLPASGVPVEALEVLECPREGGGHDLGWGECVDPGRVKPWAHPTPPKKGRKLES